MNAQPDIDAVVDVSDVGRLRRVLGEPDRETARAEIDGWTSQQLQRDGRGINLTAAAADKSARTDTHQDRHTRPERILTSELNELTISGYVEHKPTITSKTAQAVAS